MTNQCYSKCYKRLLNLQVNPGDYQNVLQLQLTTDPGSCDSEWHRVRRWGPHTASWWHYLWICDSVSDSGWGGEVPIQPHDDIICESVTLWVTPGEEVRSPYSLMMSLFIVTLWLCEWHRVRRWGPHTASWWHYPWQEWQSKEHKHSRLFNKDQSLFEMI